MQTFFGVAGGGVGDFWSRTFIFPSVLYQLFAGSVLVKGSNCAGRTTVSSLSSTNYVDVPLLYNDSVFIFRSIHSLLITPPLVFSTV